MRYIKKFNEIYGQPLEPNRCEFSLHIDNEDAEMYVAGDSDICLCITDLDEPDNDDVRDINHPDFDKFWSNACENVFLSNGFNDFATIEDARQWCLSIGMIENTSEALLNQHSLDQLKKLRSATKGYDIGDRIDKMKGTNLIWQRNAVDYPIETFEEYHKKNQSFKINQNVANFKPRKLNESLSDDTFKKLLTAFTFCFLCSYLSSMVLVNMNDINKIIDEKSDSHQVTIKFENGYFVIYCSNNKCLSIGKDTMLDLIKEPRYFPVKWGKIDPEKTNHYSNFREFILDTCLKVIEDVSKDKMVS